MLTHPTLDQLRQLGLLGMAKAFADVEASGESAALTHPEYDHRPAPRFLRPRRRTPVGGSRLPRQAWMIPDLDIWRAVQLYGDGHFAFAEQS